jgi:hypothetical protein
MWSAEDRLQKNLDHKFAPAKAQSGQHRGRCPPRERATVQSESATDQQSKRGEYNQNRRSQSGCAQRSRPRQRLDEFGNGPIDEQYRQNGQDCARYKGQQPVSKHHAEVPLSG